MRSLWVGVALLGFLNSARAEGPIVAQPCLSGREMRDIGVDRVVPPALAIAAARRGVPGADILRAAVCRDRDIFIYLITVLRKDGRVVHVMIDGPTGKVAAVQ